MHKNILYKKRDGDLGNEEQQSEFLYCCQMKVESSLLQTHMMYDHFEA